MAARITIETGLTAGTQYWIEQNVTRIGSGSSADICLPSSVIAAHAVTLEHRDQNFRVYNRSNRSLDVGDQTLAPGESELWFDGQMLTLSDGARLSIEIGIERENVDAFDDSDEGPGVDDVEVVEAISTEKAARQIDSKTVGQLLLLASCLAATIWFAGFNIDAGPASGKSQFDQIVEAALENESASKPLLRKLQFGQAALIRQDMEMAKYIFTSLHTELIAQKSQFVAENRKVELAILNYVQTQVRKLG